LDLTGFIAVLPPEAAKWLVIIPSGAAAIVHLVEAVGKSLDQLEGLKILIVGCALTFLLPSCITVTHPDGTQTSEFDGRFIPIIRDLIRDDDDDDTLPPIEPGPGPLPPVLGDPPRIIP